VYGRDAALVEALSRSAAPGQDALRRLEALRSLVGG
jgi:hypothetical protein